MIKGVGVDIVDVRRFDSVLRRYGQRFLDRVFTMNEQVYCGKKMCKHIHFAARFAAKEAVIKVLGMGIPFREIEIFNDGNGKPSLSIQGFSEYRWHLSLSHDGNYSIAYVVAEEDYEDS